MVRSDVGASGVLFTLDTESGFRDVVFITASYGLGENVVQGAVNPDEFYVYKPTLKQGKPAILRRSLGAKQIRMVYSDAARRARAQRRHAGRAAQHLLDQRRRRAGTRAPGADHRAALRPPDGHRVGEGRRQRQALHRAGAPGNGEVARPRRRRSSAITLGKRGDGRGRRPRDRPEDRRGRRARGALARRHEPRAARRRAGRRHDRPRLGTGDEARRGHRHQPRRPHLPRGDHRARTRRAGGRRHRRRARHASPTAAEVTVSCAEGDTGFIYDGTLPFERIDDRPGEHAAGAAQDHDERRQPRARLRLRACCRTRASAWRAWR